MGRGPSIEGRKNAEDSRRAKAFTKLIREITIAARGGADIAHNARLRIAVDKALSANMTKDTIERAVKRGSGADGGGEMFELRYEGYGPCGVAIIIDCMSDNQTRTVAEVRHALHKHGGNLGTSGSVAFQFSKVGELTFETLSSLEEERLFELALEAGADDVQSADGLSVVVCTAELFEPIKLALRAAHVEPIESGVVMRPANRIEIAGDAAETLMDLIDRLEDLDDVQDVYHNGQVVE